MFHRRLPGPPLLSKLLPTAGILPLLLFLTLLSHAATLLEDARRNLLMGRVADAIGQLQPLADRNDQAARLLLCRAFLAENALEQANDQCAATTAVPNASSEDFLWYGRVLGHRASASNPLSAYSLARQTRAAFEHAVALDAGNLPAIADLGEFYVEAPSIVGGGLDHARALAASVEPRSPRIAHLILGRAAAKEGDLPEAEKQFRAAISAASPADVSAAWIDLAIFFYKVARQNENASIALHRAIELNRTHGPSLVDAAHLLLRMDGDHALAASLLQQYLASPARTDEHPAFRVRLQLARLLQAGGDTAGAEQQRRLAQAEAPGYHPASRHADSIEPQVP